MINQSTISQCFIPSRNPSHAICIDGKAKAPVLPDPVSAAAITSPKMQRCSLDLYVPYIQKPYTSRGICALSNIYPLSQIHDLSNIFSFKSSLAILPCTLMMTGEAYCNETVMPSIDIRRCFKSNHRRCVFGFDIC